MYFWNISFPDFLEMCRRTLHLFQNFSFPLSSKFDKLSMQWIQCDICALYLTWKLSSLILRNLSMDLELYG